MTWSGKVNDIKVALADGTVEMDVEKIESGSGAPMSEKPGLYLFGLQWLFEQGVVHEVYLAYREVVGCTPVGIDGVEFVLGKGCRGLSSWCLVACGHRMLNG